MPQLTTNNRRPLAAISSRLLSTLFIIATIAGGWLFVRHVSSHGDSEGETTDVQSVETTGSDLTLPEPKVARADFVTERASVQRIDHVHTVSGRLAYDAALHIEVKAPVSGVLMDVRVKPGDQVAGGHVLAIINSPEIGQARAAVLNEDAKHQLILKQISRLQEITQNLRKMFELIDSNVALDEIERQFNEKTLGEYREAIMSAYSERFLASQLATSARPLAESGTLPMKTLRERDNDRHVTDARFRSVREGTAYAVSIRSQQLDVERAEAERQVMIARNHLDTLLGFSERDTSRLTSDSLSRMEVRAPFAGTIESRFFAGSERVRQSDALFVLANTESLYVSADIREKRLGGNVCSARSGNLGRGTSHSGPHICCQSALCRTRGGD